MMMKQFFLCLLTTCLAIPAVAYSQSTNILHRGFSDRWVEEDRTTRYVIPSRVMWSTSNVERPESLLNYTPAQLTTGNEGLCLLETRNGETASLLLDFGRELQGGIQIGSGIRGNKNPILIRIRLGESVTEAMSDVAESDATNDHSLRDFTIELPWLGILEVGHSGFRFARIDLLTPDEILPLHTVRAAFRFRDIPYLGSFECDDQRLNDIWATGAYTVHLNMQDYVWDGIKRDRLVWLGDLHPELMTINTVFGESDVLKATLDFGRDRTPLPGWMNEMCSYSLWWIISHRDLYLYQGDLDFLKQQRNYLQKLTDQIISCIEDNRENLSGKRFLDWPTSRSPDIIHVGLQSLTLMALEAAAEIGRWIGDVSLALKCDPVVERLKTYSPPHLDNKQAAALLALAGLENPESMSGIIDRDGAHRFSTFYGFYMLEAMAEAGDYENALKIISDYWGAMLDLGATTFWEDLFYEDALKAARIDEFVPEGAFDIHAQSGDYCYEGLRHSFCHGWAAGPTVWLSKHVLGIRPLEPGCRSVEISPNLGSLSRAKGSFPTPYGIIEVEHTRDENGRIYSRIDAPEEIRIIRPEN